MVSALISRIVILIFGTLYPAYASYKAVRTKNVKEYVKWMMYWIVFALFTSFETFSDCLLSWLPFYYEIKIVFVLWLLSPVTKGSSFLYRKFVHPQLTKREKEIDEYIMHAKDAGYSTVLRLGSRGISYATNVIVKTAIQGQSRLVNHIRRSYSMSDLSDDYVDQPRSRDRSGSIPESEDDFGKVPLFLDNRLLEDNKELESRKKDQDDPLYVPEDKEKEELISTRQIYPTNSASTRLRTGTAYKNAARRKEGERDGGEREKSDGETEKAGGEEILERRSNRAKQIARQTKLNRKTRTKRICCRTGYPSSKEMLAEKKS